LRAFSHIFSSDIPAKPTFPRAHGSKYHRGVLLLLLSSEWDQVGHNTLNYRKITGENFIFWFGWVKSIY